MASVEDWKDGLIVRTLAALADNELDSQNPLSCSQPSVTPVPKYLMLSLGTRHAHGAEQNSQLSHRTRGCIYCHFNITQLSPFWVWEEGEPGSIRVCSLEI